MGDLSVVARNVCCGDCNTQETEWASLHRGLLLCKECCFIHRSLGPQYSRVRFLKDSKWHPNQRKMVLTLAAGSANHVWEHTLLDPSKFEKDNPVKKPGPNDSLDVKRKFIQLKHFQHQFVLHTMIDPIEIRNQELHSTVRTAALDTTLRLLASGADPNFFHPEKGTRPIHVAARNGQAQQVELLFLHGAHADAPDYLGQTPVEHAMAAGHKDLAQRIIELRYELTDQLSYFVCKDIPDHISSKHIVIPSLKPANPKQEAAMKNLSPNVLEQLASDLYDEIDRRQTEKFLLSSLEPDKTKFSIAFLPVNQNYPSVRNQTRQKFARLTDEELGSLITLVLIESKKRHCNGATDIEVEKDIFLNSDNNLKSNSISLPSASVTTPGLIIDDDYPLYDSVASDEDLILAEQQTILSQQRATLDETTLIKSSNVKPVSNCDVNPLKENDPHISKLLESEEKIRELENNTELFKQEIQILKRMVNSVIHENLDFKSKLMQRPEVDSTNATLVNGHNGEKSPSPFSSERVKPSRPTSMCESKTFKKEELVGYDRRPVITESYLRKGPDALTLVQETTRRIVELIKVLIEYSIAEDIQGMKLTVNTIYKEVQEMTASMVITKEAVTKKYIKCDLENVLYQVLRMKSEVPIFAELHISNPSVQSNSSSNLFIQRIKQVCFDVGASMKQLLSSVVS